jgi:hypothetical protein
MCKTYHKDAKIFAHQWVKLFVIKIKTIEEKAAK